jgi:hypothetical protein
MARFDIALCNLVIDDLAVRAGTALQFQHNWQGSGPSSAMAWTD